MSNAYQITKTTPSRPVLERLDNGRVARTAAGRLTRGMVMERTGWPLSYFKMLVHRSELKSCGQNTQGYAVYLEDDVTTLMASKDPNEIHQNRPHKMFPACVAASTPVSREEIVAVFALLDKGLTPVQIVLKTNFHTVVVNSIIRDYHLLSGAYSVSKKTQDRINELGLECELPIQNEAQLLQALESLAKEPSCTRCLKNPRTHLCSGCATETAHTKMVRRARKTISVANSESFENATSDEG